MKLIVAVDKNWAIGNNNKLLTRIPEDTKFFRQTTTGNIVVMGKNTLLSFPNGLPLKNRTNIVLTTDQNFTAKDAIIVHSMDELQEELKKYNTDSVFCIGGESVYRQMLDMCDTAYVTYIDYSYDADAHFPNLDENENWELAQESDENTYFDIEYYFRTYKKK